MFAAWGRFVYRHRRAVAVVTLVFTVLMGISAASVTSHLSSGGWIVKDAPSWGVQERLDAEFGTGGAALVAIFLGPEGTDARSPEFLAQVETALAPLAEDPLVKGTIGYQETGRDSFISNDGTATYKVITLTVTEDEALDMVPEVEALIAPPDGVEVQLTGFAAVAYDSNEVSEQDLQRAELVSLPLALLILIGVFTSIVAAGMPLVVAGVAIPTSLGIISLLAQQTEMSIYVLNIATMLGLALAIDYSLFIVSRFREELARGRSVGDAVERSIATSGKAVVFSAVAVAIGLGGLIFFKSSALTSIGVSGMITVGASAFYAVFFLPAVLGMLGHRVNALSVRGLLTRIRPHSPIEADLYPARVNRWERLAHRVMDHPWRVIDPHGRRSC